MEGHGHLLTELHDPESPALDVLRPEQASGMLERTEGYLKTAVATHLPQLSTAGTRRQRYITACGTRTVLAPPE